MEYPQEIERDMKTLYASLSEKDRRRYAAVEAAKLGHGGMAYMAQLLGCDVKTIRQGQRDLDRPPEVPPGKVRKKGGGRKRCIDIIPDLEENFLAVVRDHTAGDPMQEGVRWTHLTLREIALRLAKAGTAVSVTVVRQLLKKHQYRKRKAQKSQAMGHHPDRNAQFEKIAELKQEYETSGNPMVSVDTKKKELLGNFCRAGQLYTQAPLRTFDHDFRSAAQGVVIPHGLYDVTRNCGHVNLGLSHDTSAFACDSIYQWWQRYGKLAWPDATSLLLLCDGGGSNSANQYLFKEDLQKLVDKMGIEIRVAHYPPYASKYNPIEHRLFPHLTRACQGVIFHSVEIVKELMKRAQTQTGLRVTVNIIKKIYETGRKVSDGFKDQMKIVFDEYLPQWNYTAIPAGR